MPQTELILDTNNKLDSLHATVEYLKELLEKMITTDTKIDDWITEKEAMRISGLSRTTLSRLRKTGELTSSSIAGKHLYYRYSDFKKILDRNEENR